MIIVAWLRRARHKLEAKVQRPEASGQSLVLFALMLVVLLGFAALAIDVTRVYADMRFYRATADAAALAGAQDLQGNNTRVVGAADYIRARGHALATLELQLGGKAVAACASTSSNIVDCALNAVDPTNPYRVSIKTDPSPSCATCNPARAVQVTVRRPAYPLSFAGIPPFDQTAWNVQTTSVAGLQYGRSYAIITLRPPMKVGATFKINDIELDGGTVVNVQKGDVGSNANMVYAGCLGSGTVMTIDPDYGMYYWDPSGTFGQGWGTACEPQPPTPAVQTNPSLIKDPNYQYPSMTGALTFDDARASKAGTIPAVQRADTDAGCLAEAAKVDASRYTFMATQAPNTIYCYNPGIYQSGSGAKNATITVGTGDVGLLKPGAYYLKSGMDIGGRIIGGYVPAPATGVALMFDECRNACIFSGNNAVTIALNAGTKFPPGAAGTAAAAAVDWAGNPVVTSGPSSPTPPLIMTLLVNKDPSCFVPTSAPFVEPAGCNASNDKTINIAGGGGLALEGVQYMPTDNVEIHGGSTGNGQVGQIISWTLFYSGHTHINQEGPGGEGPGILRIDEACSPSAFCNNP
jgi:Flp pilus assembly protein TadG